jgi:hypothetical protein
MWARVATLLLGIWLMMAPGLLHFNNIIADNDHIVGPLIVTFSTIAIWECTRNVRMLNLPLGAWLLFSPGILGYVDTAAFASDYTVGVLTILLSLVKQKRKNSFGGGWTAIWKSENITDH